MASDLIDACASYPLFSCEMISTTLMGLIKLGDFASDILFINALGNYRQILGDLRDEYGNTLNVSACMACVVIFTSIGFSFDIYKAYRFIKHEKDYKDLTWNDATRNVVCPKCLRIKLWGANEEEKEEEEDRTIQSRRRRKEHIWDHINFAFEDLPQFVTVCSVWAFIPLDDACDGFLEDDAYITKLHERGCTDEQIEYSNALSQDAMLSLLFTVIVLLRALVFYTRFLCCKRSARDDADDIDNQAVQFRGIVNLNPDGTQTVVKETINPDGTKTTTTTTYALPTTTAIDDNHAMSSDAEPVAVTPLPAAVEYNTFNVQPKKT